MTEDNASVEIDFKAINAVAIKRIDNSIYFTKAFATVVIYQKADGEIDREIFYCSLEEHEKLAKQFREYMERCRDD